MTTSAPIGAAKIAWLLIRLQLIRFGAKLASAYRFNRKREGGPARTATPGKARLGSIYGVLIALAMTFGSFNIASQAVSNIQETLGSVTIRAPQASAPLKTPKSGAQASPDVVQVPAPPAPGFTLPAGAIQGASLVTLLLLGAVALMSLGSRELAQPDWDLEWQATLPAPLSTLLAVRILSRTILNAAGVMTIWPFLTSLAWASGYRFGAPLVALAATLPLLLIIATVQTLIDTGLRLRLSPPRLRNLQALITITAVAAFYLCLSVGMPAKGQMVLGWATGQPDWTSWLPAGLAVHAIAAAGPGAMAGPLAVLAAEAAVCAALGMAIMQRLLRNGVVAAGARESGRAAQPAQPAARAKGRERRRLLTPIQARELLLLGRDRSFLVQTLVMPLVIVGAQIFLNTGGADLLASPSEHPEHLAAIAFGVAAYGLMFSAFQTLNAEGQALWILYCTPQPLESILRQKAILWGAASLIYPAAIFAYIFAAGGGPSLALLELAAVVILGAPIFAIIAASLGVFACDPLAQTIQRRLRPSFVYLYMLLSSTYVYAIYSSSVWQRAGLITLTALLSVALWQKARDQLPYLLDPTASPPARVSVSDGLVAALLFFVLQGVISAVLLNAQHSHALTGRIVLIAFAGAGAATFALMRFGFWRLKSQGAPRTFGRGGGRAMLWGALGGAGAAAAAFVYLKLVMHTALFEQATKTILTGRENVALMAVLAICAAPVFEEFIFRGLIFGGLRRSLGVVASALASAAIFAIVHPAVSVIPVFGLGVAAAFVYERSRLLVGPMTAHATYNAAVVLAFPLLL